MSTDHAERRRHARLQAQLDIEVEDASGHRYGAQVRDLSQGGACLFARSATGMVGDALELFLPDTHGDCVATRATIMRASAVDGGMVLGVKFDEAQPDALEVVDYLLGSLLVGAGGGMREHPRIARRISVPCETPDEMVAVVENISLGGLAMNLDVPLEVGEQVLVVLPGEDGEDLLSLQCRVANLRELEGSEPPQYLVGLEFSELSAQRRALLDAMLVGLLRGA